MKKQVYEYFENLNNSQLYLNSDNDLTIDTHLLTKVETEDKSVSKYQQGSKYFYLKPWKLQSIHEVASSNLYNKLGILTPPCYITKPIYGIVTENVRDLKDHGLLCTLADSTPLYNISKEIPLRLQALGKWEILYNKRLRKYFLEFMTEDCLDNYLSKCLADEIRSDGDGHLGNFFLYKKIDKNGHVGDKFEGIIPIDLECSDVIGFFDACCLKVDKSGFQEFLKSYRTPFGPLANWLNSTYQEDINALRNAISRGLVKKQHIDLLKKEIKYDFPREIKRIGNKHKIECANRDYECVSRLWNYHRNNIGRDLGL